jgi:hypothetical protein
MFGFATEDFIRVYVGAKIDVLTKRIDEALAEVARGKVQPVNPVDTVKPEVVQLFEVEVSLNQERIATYRDVTHVHDMMEHRNELVIYRKRGKVVLKGDQYSYSLHELVEGRVETEIRAMLTGQVETDKESAQTNSALRAVVDRQGGHIAELHSYADELNHRIEMLELRLGSQSFGKQTEPKATNKPQPKGAKR